MVQIRALFTKRFTIFLVCIIMIITLLQSLRLHQYVQIYGARGSIIDFILFTIGGWESPNLFTFLLTWICLNMIFLYVSARSRIVIETFGGFLAIRKQNRVQAWLSNCAVQFIISIILFLIYFLIVYGIGVVSFNGTLETSSYTLEFYPDWVMFLDMNFWSVVGIIFVIFVSGLYAMFTVGQVILLVCRNTVQAFMSLAGIMITGSIIYTYMGAPRILALPFYISTMSLSVTRADISIAIFINIMVGMFFTFLGGVCMRKIDIRY